MPRPRFVEEARIPEEEKVRCPYNDDHWVPISQIQDHVRICRESRKGSMRHKDDNHVESKRRVRDNRMERDDRRLRLDNGSDGGYHEKPTTRYQKNGRGRVNEEWDSEPAHRFASTGHPKETNSNIQQCAAPKGFAISKGFGGARQNGDFGHHFGNRFDDFEQDGQRKKHYARSKSNLDSLDEESVRRAQQSVVEQVREFQSLFGGGGASQRTSANPDHGVGNITRLRDALPPAAEKSSQAYGSDRSVDAQFKRQGYGRGRPIANAAQEESRPGQEFSRNGYDDRHEIFERHEDWYDGDEKPRESAPLTSRFKILKASQVFGPIEVAAAAVPYPKPTVGPSVLPPTKEDDDWSSKPRRSFVILKASDVFHLDSPEESGNYFGDRQSRWGDRPFYRHHDQDSFERDDWRGARSSRRQFEMKHPDEVFSERRIGQRSHAPAVNGDSAKSSALPWPYNRLAENSDPNDRQDRMTREAVQVQGHRIAATTFSKIGAFARMSPEERNLKNNEETETRSTLILDDAQCGSSSERAGDEFETASNAETVSSTGRISSPVAWSQRQLESPSVQSVSNGSGGSDVAAASASGAKPKVLSIYDQYAQFGLDDDDFNFLRSDQVAPALMNDTPTFGNIVDQLRELGVTQSPGFGSSHSSSPYLSSFMQ